MIAAKETNTPEDEDVPMWSNVVPGGQTADASPQAGYVSPEVEYVPPEVEHVPPQVERVLSLIPGTIVE
jgi:hypothetical protein